MSAEGNVRIIAALCVASVFFSLIFLLTGEAHYSALAPELFGRAQMHVLYAGPYRLGILVNADCTFLLFGKEASGHLVQVRGPMIYDRPTENGQDFPARLIPYFMRARGNHFSGSILFRGHTRKFCSEDMGARGCFREAE